MAWRVVVDMDRCESNAVCVDLAPDVFDVGDDDLLRVLDEHPADDRRADVVRAVARCPKQALSIVES
jgi:ferredoxin